MGQGNPVVRTFPEPTRFIFQQKKPRYPHLQTSWLSSTIDTKGTHVIGDKEQSIRFAWLEIIFLTTQGSNGNPFSIIHGRMDDSNYFHYC